MGAYYQWQLRKEWSDEIQVFEPELFKFLESFYHFNECTLRVMNYIKNSGSAFQVNTVSDYDNEVKEWLNDSWIKSEEKELTEGYFVNDETKTYFSLAYLNDFYLKMSKDHDIWLISPLALLTRLQAHSLGGGDFDVEEVGNKALEKFNPELISSWKTGYIRYSDEPIDGYHDITEEIICWEEF